MPYFPSESITPFRSPVANGENSDSPMLFVFPSERLHSARLDCRSKQVLTAILHGRVAQPLNYCHSRFMLLPSAIVCSFGA